MTRSIPRISIFLVSILFFLMFGCGSPFDENVIPDAKLRYEIGTFLHEDGNAKITADDMLGLIKLDAEYHQFWDSFNHSPISNLAGLEYAENLRVLILASNSISDVSPLEGLKNLRVLNLRNNYQNYLVDTSPEGIVHIPLEGIVDISPLEGLNNLIELNLSDNNILDVSPLEGLNNLQRLYLNDNDVVDVSPLAGLKNLQKLDLRNNPLSDNSKNLIIPIIKANGAEVLY